MHKAEECKPCSIIGKNLTVNRSFGFELSKKLSEPMLEAKLQFAGSINNEKGRKAYIRLAIDRFTKCLSKKITTC